MTELPENVAQSMRDYLNSTSLTAEALTKMKALADQVEDLEMRLANRDREVVVLTRERNGLRNEVGGIRNREDACVGLEASLAEREAKITDLEKTAAVADARSATFKECFQLTMRNIVVREQVHKSLPIPDNSGYVTQHSESTDTTRETE